MEPSKFSELSSMDACDDQDSNNMDSASVSEDDEQPDVSQNCESAGSSEPSTLQEPSFRRGRNQPRSRTAMVSNQTKRAAPKTAGRFNPARSDAPRPPVTNLSLMICTAVATCQRKSGLSMRSLKKIVTNMGYDMAKKKRYFLRSIKGMVAKGQLWQVKGIGATDSFKINLDMWKKKDLPKVRGRGRKAKEAAKKKGAPATPRGRGRGRNNKPNKQRKVGSSRATKRSKMPSMQAGQSQVKV